ncbi:alpha/beta hydrolase [Nocardia sp. alder85J]|uniref:alpha/beta hydrolase n=1 Tax=Nocardia sp. alder85J TaxID=2862949 RepID=UPI001CD21926|nr:alpha/beta hydrolase [Nocardia sp. alder85J]MCX4098665.1 lysophospholipase [Nocardia sp. alder85J]
MPRSETSRFEGKGGRIFWRAWLPDGEVRAVATIVHGVGEHSGRYEHVGQLLAEHGVATYADDHIGHGQSAGGNANIGSLDEAADNEATLLDLAAQRHPGLPRFLIGHSMGSLIALYLVTRAPLELTGLVVSAPPLIQQPGNAVERVAWPVLTRLAPVLSRHAPDLRVVKLDNTAISRDAEVVAAYNADPLVHHGPLPARTAAEIVRGAAAVLQRLDRLTVPTLVLQGTADRLAPPAGADLIERGAAATDLTVIRYPGLYHEVFNEPEQQTVLGDLVGWLEAHLPPQ